MSNSKKKKRKNPYFDLIISKKNNIIKYCRGCEKEPMGQAFQICRATH